MSEAMKKIQQVCKCENCGNEAEMVVTCTLAETDTDSTKAVAGDAGGDLPHTMTRVKGTGTCSTCGNEADGWVDL